MGTGSGMSNPRMTGPSGPQHGLPTWCDTLNDAWKLWIMRERYGNDEESIKVLKKSATEKSFAERHFPGDTAQLHPRNFSPRAFLVCSS